jgi:hypothetical protein
VERRRRRNDGECQCSISLRACERREISFEILDYFVRRKSPCQGENESKREHRVATLCRRRRLGILFASGAIRVSVN